MEYSFNLRSGINFPARIYSEFLASINLPEQRVKISGVLNYDTQMVTLSYPAIELIHHDPVNQRISFLLESEVRAFGGDGRSLSLRAPEGLSNSMHTLLNTIENKFALALCYEAEVPDLEQEHIYNGPNYLNLEQERADEDNVREIIRQIFERMLSLGAPEAAANVQRPRANVAQGPTFAERLEKINCELDEPEYADLICPIAKVVMNDPITVSTGQSYDRASLIQCFAHKNNPSQIQCPLTKQPIKLSELDNLTAALIKTRIEEVVKKKEVEYAAKNAALKQPIKDAQPQVSEPKPIKEPLSKPEVINVSQSPSAEPKPVMQPISVPPVSRVSQVPVVEPKTVQKPVSKATVPVVLIKEKKIAELKPTNTQPVVNPVPAPAPYPPMLNTPSALAIENEQKNKRTKECIAIIKPLFDRLEESIKTIPFATKNGKLITELLVSKLTKFKDDYVVNLQNGMSKTEANQRLWNACKPCLLETKMQLNADIVWYSILANFFRKLANACTSLFTDNKHYLFAYTQSAGLPVVQELESKLVTTLVLN